MVGTDRRSLGADLPGQVQVILVLVYSLKYRLPDFGTEYQTSGTSLMIGVKLVGEFLEMGADAYLTSPLSLRELLARVRSLLRNI